jgi:hypothetical protein
VVGLGILSDHKGEFQVGKLCEKLFAPGRRTFGSWRKVSGLFRTRETKAPRQNSDLSRVVEHIACDTQPFAQAISVGVAKGNA